MICLYVTIILLIETLSDIRTKTVSLIRLAVYLLAALTLNIIFEYQSWMSVGTGMSLGIILLVYAFATKENIGYGDSLMFIVTGACLGLSDNLRLMFFSLVMAVFVGLAYIIVTKKGLKSRIPFMPCILFTYLIMTMVNAYES